MRISIEVGRAEGVALLTAALLTLAAMRLSSESFTFTTTYPAPAGVYNQIVTTGTGGAGALDTTLNRAAGNTILVPASNAAGRVGVGTNAPNAKLAVAGAVSIADGTQGDGKVLTSNAAGVASWQYCSFAP